MRCIKCNTTEDKVIDSRTSKDGTSIRRRRECLHCGYRFTTYEQLERADLLVVKRNNVREPLDRDKLLNSFVKACEKRPVSIDTMERATETILRELQSENVREIPTRVVGLKVMEHLKEIDPVAFVRYASVYRAFADVGEFIEEIASMEREPTTKDGLQPDLFSP